MDTEKHFAEEDDTIRIDKRELFAQEESDSRESFAEKMNDLFSLLRRKLTKVPGVKRPVSGEQDIFVERRGNKPFVLAVLFAMIKVFIVAVLLIGCAGAGLFLGVAKAYVETTPNIDTSQLTMSDRTSYIYDKDGNLITTFAGMEYRDWADIEDIPDMLKNALISIEDVRFYKHGGVDYKRLFSAVVNTLRNADTHGGSTLTQQLIKNKVLTNEESYKRKIKEAYLAAELEGILSKDDILEAYMNDAFLGSSDYGFKTAAKDYFGKELSELTIRECAMLAGMVQKPYLTNPRANTYSRTLTDSARAELEALYESGGITRAQYEYSVANNNQMYVTDRRTNVVLLAMYDAGFITKEQYESALNDTVNVVQDSASSELYDMPYFVEYGIRDVVTHLLAQRGELDTTANRTSVENELRTGGYSIYLTVDTQMQHLVQDTLSTWDEYPELADPSASMVTETTSDGTTIDTVQPQAAAVVFDYHTGELRAIVGGRDTPTVKKGWNRAYQSTTEVGSAIKPLTVYGPALDLGSSPATVILNYESPIDGWDTEKGYPAIGDTDLIGPITLRTGLVKSLNVAAARTLLELVSIPKSVEYLTALGVDPSRISPTGSGLALGTMGITPIEMAAAYGAIANEGEYKEPLSFSRVVDDNGKVILDAADIRQTHEVFKKSTAYMLVDMMTNAVQSGTGTAAKIKGMTVAGKTGTNSSYGSVYFAGITPYYTASVWIGHDNYAQKLKSKSTGGKYAAALWQAFMSQIHTNLADKPIIDESPTEIGLVKRTVCSISGKLATDACYADTIHPPVTDWFASDSAPTELCDMHALANICADSGEPASAYCPSVIAGSVVLIHTDSKYMTIDPAALLTSIPNAIFTGMTSAEYDVSGTVPITALCHIHTPAWLYGTGSSSELLAAQTNARQLISEVQTYLGSVQTLSVTDRNTLLQGIADLQTYMEYSVTDYILRATEQLRYTYNVLYESNPPVGAN